MGNTPSPFPPSEIWPADGPLACGGSLTMERLVDAYSRGIFPWPVSSGPRGLLWWSPDPRGILDLDRLHVPRRLQRTIRTGGFTLSTDLAFEAVVRGCAASGTRHGNTWITPSMFTAYQRLHEAGVCHSVEVWREGTLAGGLYGVSIGGMFAGESMFSIDRDASKVALCRLALALRDAGCRLFDVQLVSPHLEQFGATAVPRETFLERHGWCSRSS
jgi:leucyl/phenylalanyl-tRNA--protein transferase